MVTGYIFDIIVVRIDTPMQKFDDPNLFTVDVNYNNVSLSITASRINVAEFRSGRSYEFESSPDELRADMEARPLKLTVKYDNVVVGKWIGENSYLELIVFILYTLCLQVPAP